MFLKPLRVKSKSAIKGSERKKLRQQCQTTFTSLTDDEICKLLPNKSSLQLYKVVASGERLYDVYLVDEVPTLFISSQSAVSDLIPTVYSLWKFPDMLTSLVVNTGVDVYIKRGSDIMNPGIVSAAPGYVIPEFDKNRVLSISVIGNGSSVAIGYSLIDSQGLQLQKGRAIAPVHFHNDHLCSLGKTPEMPTLPCPISEVQQYESIPSKPEQSVDTQIVETFGVPEESDESTTPDMDLLIEKCFFSAIKDTSNKISLPVLSSSFMSCLSKYCATDINIDFKKSTYKKMSTFLQLMAEQEVIEISSKDGVDSITAINKRAKIMRSHDVMEVIRKPEGKHLDEILTIQEVYQPKTQSLPIFKRVSSDARYNIQQVKTMIKDYIECFATFPVYIGMVTLDNQLTEAVKGKKTPVETTLRVDIVVKAIIENGMNVFSMISRRDSSKLITGPIKKIEFAIVITKFKKKLTTVKNLDLYLIDASDIADKVKHALSCSTSVTPMEGKTNRSYVTVQGNQIKYICKLLTDSYDVRQKYMSGLEKMRKK